MRRPRSGRRRDLGACSFRRGSSHSPHGIGRTEKDSHGHHPVRSNGRGRRCVVRFAVAATAACACTRTNCTAACCCRAAGAEACVPTRPEADANAPLSIVPRSGRRCAGSGARAYADRFWRVRPRARDSGERGRRLRPAAAMRSKSRPSAARLTRRRNSARCKPSFPRSSVSHEPIVRRADLGAKGVYYRALVGPYASMDQAAAMCSSLKAAGGTCIVQRD